MGADYGVSFNMLLARYSTLFMMLLSIFLAAPAMADKVIIQDAYVRETIPGANNSVAYLEIHNQKAVGVTLVAVTSDRIPRVKIHAHQHHDGMMAMRAVKQVMIPANSYFKFKPGGHHLMLMGLKEPLLAGELIEFSFQFSDGESLQVEAPVQSIASEFE